MNVDNGRTDGQRRQRPPTRSVGTRAHTVCVQGSHVLCHQVATGTQHMSVLSHLTKQIQPHISLSPRRRDWSARRYTRFYPPSDYFRNAWVWPTRRTSYARHRPFARTPAFGCCALPLVPVQHHASVFIRFVDPALSRWALRHHHRARAGEWRRSAWRSLPPFVTPPIPPLCAVPCRSRSCFWSIGSTSPIRPPRRIRPEPNSAGASSTRFVSYSTPATSGVPLLPCEQMAHCSPHRPLLLRLVCPV